MNFFHVSIYVPKKDADALRNAIAEAGAGRIGSYDRCSFSVDGIGRFRPLKGANPALGTLGRIEEVEEERIEVVVDEDKLSAVLRAAKDTHPYEEPAIHLWRMEDYKGWM